MQRRLLNGIRLAAVCAAVLCLHLSPADGAVYYIAKHGNNTNNGGQSAPWLTIQYAVTNASAIQSGDTLLVGGGDYFESVIFTDTVHRLTLKGGHDTNDWSWAPADHPTRISSSGSGCLILGRPSGGSACSTNTTIIGFTLSGGQYGIYQPYCPGIASSLTVSHCIITNHSVAGVQVDEKGYPDIRNCVIANSSIGIYIVSEAATMTNIIYNCTIVTNKRANIWFSSKNCGEIQICNTISAFAWGSGGAGQEGYGIATHTSLVQDAHVHYSLIYGNTFTTYGTNIFFESGVITGQAPGFVSMSSNIFTLTKQSPCVNAGTNITSINNDLALQPRPIAHLFDIGAYESLFGGVAGSVIGIR